MHVAGHHQSSRSVVTGDEIVRIEVCSCGSHRAQTSHRHGEEGSPPDVPVPEHDSDRCCICQAVAFQRDLAITFHSAVERIESLPAETCPLESIASPIAEDDHESISVRGPPHA